MGLLFSCCRRRKQAHDHERDPLLQPAHEPSRRSLEKLADVVGALKAGKLPSQDQLDAFVKNLLASDLLKSGNLPGTALDASLAGETERLVDSAREAMEAVLQMGMEKNDDNRLQDLIYNMRQLSSDAVRVDTNVSPPKVNDELRESVQKELGNVATAIPSEDEVAQDAKALINSFQTISSLLLTSSAFRFIISDFLVTTREYISNLAQGVKLAAQQVESVAGTVDDRVRPTGPSPPTHSLEESAGFLPDKVDVPRTPATFDTSSTESKYSILERIELLILQAQRSPMYNSALRTILFIIRKYSSRVQLAAQAASRLASDTGDASFDLTSLIPIISPDPALKRTVEDIRVILERFASGHSLDPLLNAMLRTICDIGESPDKSAHDAQAFFERWGSWLDRALSIPDWANSRSGRMEAEELYDQGKEILGRDGVISADMNRMLDEADRFAEALQRDRTTRRLVASFSSCSDQFSRYTQQFLVSTGQAVEHWKLRLIQGLLAWALPKVLRAVKTLPMPRVEYMSIEPGGQQIAVVVDALLMQAQEELVPDELKIVEWGEISITMNDREGFAFSAPAAAAATAFGKTSAASSRMSPALAMSPTFRALSPTPDGNLVPTIDQIDEQAASNQTHTSVKSSTRIQIHVTGLRVAAYDVGYFARYNYFSWLGYEDEGLLTATVGQPGKERDGLSLDIDLEFDSNPEDGHGSIFIGERKLFRVHDVRVDLPGLAIYIRKSRHWILNTLIGPLVGPVGRIVGSRVLASQIRSLLEKLEEKMSSVKTQAEIKAKQRRKEGIAREGKSPSVTAEDWWWGILETFGKGGEPDDEQDEAERDTYSEAFTSATTKGIVRTSYTQPEPPPAPEDGLPGSSVPEASKSVLAIGLGAQVLPGKGEPISRESPKEMVHDIAEEVRRGERDVEESMLQKGMEMEAQVREAMEARAAVDGAGERVKRIEREERRRGGWQSRVFDDVGGYRD